MNFNHQLIKKMSPKKMEKLKDSNHIIDQLLIAGHLTHHQYNTFRVYEKMRHLLWRHRDVKTQFLTYSQSWGRIRGRVIDFYENPDLERFWIWIERHLKGRQYLNFLDHVVKTGQSPKSQYLPRVLESLYTLWKPCDLNTLMAA